MAQLTATTSNTECCWVPCADDAEVLTAGHSSSYSAGFKLPEPSLDARRNSLLDFSDIFDFPVAAAAAPQDPPSSAQNGGQQLGSRISPL